MSFENPLALLEADAFMSILSFVDFFDLNLRKSAIKACVNMAVSANTKEYIKKLIVPAIPSLTNFSKPEGSSEVEKIILEKGILCFYYIFNNIRNYNIHTQDPQIFEKIMQYGLLNNLFDVHIIYNHRFYPNS